jgi:hypothetical protein
MNLHYTAAIVLGIASYEHSASFVFLFFCFFRNRKIENQKNQKNKKKASPSAREKCH